MKVAFFSSVASGSGCEVGVRPLPLPLHLQPTPGLWGSRSTPPPSCSDAEAPSLAAVLRRQAARQSDWGPDPCQCGAPRPSAWSWCRGTKKQNHKLNKEKKRVGCRTTDLWFLLCHHKVDSLLFCLSMKQFRESRTVCDVTKGSPHTLSR